MKFVCLRDITIFTFYVKIGTFSYICKYKDFEKELKDKGFSQINNVPDSYIASDNIEVGFGNKIPLCLFGFLY